MGAFGSLWWFHIVTEKKHRSKWAMFHSKLSNHKRLSRLAMTEWSFSRLFHQMWILLCRHLIRRSQQFKFRAPTQKLLVQFVHMYNCHLLSWISSLHTNTFLRHLDLISPNLRIFRCEITLTRALDFMRLGFPLHRTLWAQTYWGADGSEMVKVSSSELR